MAALAEREYFLGLYVARIVEHTEPRWSVQIRVSPGELQRPLSVEIYLRM